MGKDMKKSKGHKDASSLLFEYGTNPGYCTVRLCILLRPWGYILDWRRLSIMSGTCSTEALDGARNSGSQCWNIDPDC
jgi:hypothetical protein